MIRKTFALRALPGRREAVDAALKALAEEMRAAAARLRVENFSMWAAEDMVYGYGEYPDDWTDSTAEAGLRGKLEKALEGNAELLCAPGTMRLMYHDIGIVRQDKSLIRHRVFSTKLKPGCEEEYKRRHDALVAARGDRISEGPDSNFTIWYGAGYIFGYDEKVKAFDHEPTEAEKAADIAWETRQLEIMDWLTDDVDWITGQKHESIRQLV